jgi:hypothetical protein
LEASRLLLVEVTFRQLDAELVEKISNATAIARENMELVAALAIATIGQREAASNAAAAEACQARGWDVGTLNVLKHFSIAFEM